MRMKRIIFSLSLLLFMAGMYGQTGHITLEECQQKRRITIRWCVNMI